MSKHTPEPWIARDENNLCNKAGDWLAEFGEEADLRRAKACVNALEGIGEPELWVRNVKNSLVEAYGVGGLKSQVGTIEQALANESKRLYADKCDCGHEEDDGLCYGHQVIRAIEKALKESSR